MGSIVVIGLFVLIGFCFNAYLNYKKENRNEK